MNYVQIWFLLTFKKKVRTQIKYIFILKNLMYFIDCKEMSYLLVNFSDNDSLELV